MRNAHSQPAFGARYLLFSGYWGVEGWGWAHNHNGDGDDDALMMVMLHELMHNGAGALLDVDCVIVRACRER